MPKGRSREKLLTREENKEDGLEGIAQLARTWGDVKDAGDTGERTINRKGGRGGAQGTWR